VVVVILRDDDDGGSSSSSSSSSLLESDASSSSLSLRPLNGIHFDRRSLSLSFFLRISLCFLSRWIGITR
jgi:hypothetical protein